MKNPPARPRAAEENTKWGYAIAGAIALGFAAVIQFAFGELSHETLSELPPFVRIPYTVAGKLGLTVPLALLGLGLIIRDVWGNQRVKVTEAAKTPSAIGLKRASSRVVPPPVPAGAPAGTAADPNAEPLAEELEAGEPMPEEEQPQPDSGQRKIAALPGRFEGRVSTDETGATGGPAPAASEPSSTKTKSNGTVELASAKYLNKNKKSGGRNSHQGGTGP